MKPKILLANLSHETHTFLTRPTTRADFAVSRGEEIITLHQGRGSTVDGFLEVATQAGWEVVPTIAMRAAPAGLVEQDVVEEFLDALLADLRSHLPLDGVYLALHGAMVSSEWDDVEGEVLQRVRRALAEQERFAPVCGVLDLHCNFTPAMAENSDCLVGYRKNPHTDARESAVRGAQILRRLLEEGLRPRTYYLHPPLLFSPRGTGHASNPMKAVLARIGEIEAADAELINLNAFGGFAYADIPDAGFSVTCTTTGDEAKARAYLEELAAIATAHREEGHPQDRDLEEVLAEISPDEAGPILLVEPSDNIGGGTPGDGTGALGRLLRSSFQNIVGVLKDPEAVAQCRQAGEGAKLSLNIGGKSDNFHGSPLAVEAEVVRLTDGVFTLEDPHSHLAASGNRVEMGSCAVIRTANATILLTTRKTAPMDLGQLRSQGIAPEAAFLIVIKAAVSHQQVYDPIARKEFYVDTPGLGTSNLCSLPYRKIQRPIFPLDE